MLEQRIAQLEERLRRANVVDEKKIDTETVGVGVRVHVKDQKSGDSRKFQIVGPTEAEPGRAEALQRVADRQGAQRPQARRRREPSSPSRPQEEVQDHQDRSGLAAVSSSARLAADGRAGQRRPGSPRPSRMCSPSGARSSSACARDGVEPFPHSSTGASQIAAVHERPRGLERRRGDRARLPGRRADRRPARPGQGGVPRPRRRQRPDPAPRPARRARRRGLRRACVGLDLGDIDRRRRHRLQDPPRRALAAG